MKSFSRMCQVAALGALFTATLHAQDPSPDERIRQVALRVAELDARRQWTSASAATIDSLLGYYADSVVYEHPSVGAVVRGKAAVRSGMLRFLGSRPVTAYQAPQVTVGARVAVLEWPAGPDPRRPTEPVPPTRRALRVLEFDAAGMVQRIVDYPW